MRWSDTSSSNYLPQRIRLASAGDITLVTGARVPGSQGPFPVLSVEQGDSATWRGLIRAEWYQLSDDSINLAFSIRDADWGGALILYPDSIAGVWEFSGFDQDGSYPSHAIGIRVTCPNGAV